VHPADCSIAGGHGTIDGPLVLALSRMMYSTQVKREVRGVRGGAKGKNREFAVIQ
jgi:hypothetical protein